MDMFLSSKDLKNFTLHSEAISILQLLTSLLTTACTLPLEFEFMAASIKFSEGSMDDPRSVVRVFIITIKQ